MRLREDEEEPEERGMNGYYQRSEEAELQDGIKSEGGDVWKVSSSDGAAAVVRSGACRENQIVQVQE